MLEDLKDTETPLEGKILKWDKKILHNKETLLKLSE